MQQASAQKEQEICDHMETLKVSEMEERKEEIITLDTVILARLTEEAVHPWTHMHVVGLCLCEKVTKKEKDSNLS